MATKLQIMRTRALRPCLALATALVLSAVASPALAGDDPTFVIEFNDGTMSPHRLEVPADTRIELKLVNKGKTPAEFESLPLRKEKVLAPESESFMVIKGLDPGEYSFFDDFHPEAPPAVLVAR
ncbi:cupredoxin domain-containing protein [Azospirillum sp. B506]|uniref:cupredoxin domain-containing protein n=1 Tax=Azospirillum sp. B506 TaxID=137721 RepID=UPI0018FFCC92|nr:cupredoxin domain-containing protein [Azospirillum sp. B506]